LGQGLGFEPLEAARVEDHAVVVHGVGAHLARVTVTFRVRVRRVSGRVRVRVIAHHGQAGLLPISPHISPYLPISP